MKLDSRIARGTAILSLLAMVTVPMSAWAVPGVGPGKAAKAAQASAAKTALKNVKKAVGYQSPIATAKMAGRQKALADRINKVLANRQQAFDNAASHISRRIGVVASLATTVAAAGGDVTGVLGQLDSARATVADAKAAEAIAVDMFKAVPTTSDKKAAFKAAKDQAHVARVKLSEARAILRNAILALEVVVNGLVPVTP